MTDSAQESWHELAEQLEARGVPEQRANVVALRDAGHSYSEIAAKLEFGANNNDRSQVHRHLEAYREQRANAVWLSEHGPEVQQ